MPVAAVYEAAVYEDSHEPRLKVKDENLAPIQDAAMLWLLGDKVGHTVVGNPRYED